MKIKSIFSLFIIFLLLLDCQKTPIDQNKIKIYTSIFPIYNIIDSITPDLININYAIPIGANPHTFDANPELAIELKKSDLFIGIDPHFDGWITKFLDTGTPIIYLSDFLSDSEHGMHHNDSNPHLWLSISNVKEILPELSKELNKLFSDSINLSTNLSTYMQNLDSTQVQIKTMFENLHNKKFIQWHEAWNDFAEENNLEILGTLEHGHGDQPSIREFNQLIQKAKSENVKVIAVGLNVENPTLSTLVSAINGNLIRLDTLGDRKDPNRSTYIKLMINNATLLAKALKNQDKL